MRVTIRSLSLAAIQEGFNEVCRVLTSLDMSRGDGVAPADTEDISKPRAGRIGYNRATAKLSRFDGETWVDF